MNLKRIFTLSIAEELIRRGNNLVEVEKHKYEPDLQVFRFEHTEKLEKDLVDITVYNN